MFLVKADVEIPDRTLRELRSRTDADLGIDSRLLEAARGALSLACGLEQAGAGFDGTFHRLYVIRLEHDELRLLRFAAFPGEPWITLMDLEARLAELLRRHGLPVPACEFLALEDGSKHRGLQTIDFVAGEAASARDTDESAMQRNLEAIARFLAMLHGIRGERFGPASRERPTMGLWDTWVDYLRLRLDDHLRQCVEIGATSSDEARLIDAIFEEPRSLEGFEGAPSLLHGDPGGHNFVIRDGNIAGVLDWEDCLLGDPLFDIASLCTFQPTRRHTHILRAYGETLARGSSAWRRFWVYFLRISLAKTVHRHRFQYPDKVGRPGASNRIQIALDELAAA